MVMKKMEEKVLKNKLKKGLIMITIKFKTFCCTIILLTSD